MSLKNRHRKGPSSCNKSPIVGDVAGTTPCSVLAALWDPALSSAPICPELRTLAPSLGLLQAGLLDCSVLFNPVH